MPAIYEGSFATPPGRFVLVAARFNAAVVDALVGGAVDGLRRHGVDDEAIDLVRVPGSFEIPLVAQKLAASGRYAAVICLGAVIRGDTDHYDYVAGEAAGGVARRRAGDGSAGDLRHPHLRHAGAGHQPRRGQGRQQGLRGRADRDRDGQPDAPVAGWQCR